MWWAAFIACTLPKVGDTGDLELDCDSLERRSSVELRVLDDVGLPLVPDVVSFEHDGVIEEVVDPGSSYVHLGDGTAGTFTVHAHASAPSPTQPECLVDLEGELVTTVPECAQSARQVTLTLLPSGERCP